MLIGIINLPTFAGAYFTPEKLIQIIRILLILAIGIPLLKIATRVTGKVICNKFSTQSEMLIRRFIYYAGIIIILMTVMNELGFKLSALLGAAGIMGIAIGFAAQTSISNIISGIFLISERPFVIGDLIQVGETIGTVLTIDLLSIKIKTADNRYVRLPNETMLKSEVINISHYHTRRLNLHLSVSYNDDLKLVLDILAKIAATEPKALKQPAPLLQIEQFNLTGINILFGVWGKQEDLPELKNALMLAIREQFNRHGISMPISYTGITSNPTQSGPAQ